MSFEPTQFLVHLGEDSQFPRFDNSNLTYCGSRIHCFASANTRAVCLNVLYRMDSAFGTDALSNWVYVAVHRGRRIQSNVFRFPLIYRGVHQGDVTGSLDQFLRPSVKEIYVRWRKISLAKIGEWLEANPKAGRREGRAIPLAAVARFLVDEHRDLALASESEIQVTLPELMTPLLTIEKWRHPTVEDQPIEMESFQKLAEVLSAKDASLYRDKDVPNTDWRKWVKR